MKVIYNLRYPVVILLIVFFTQCESDDGTLVDCSASGLQSSVGAVTDASCGLDNGSFEISVSGGTAPYQIEIPGSGSQALQAGNNTVDGIAGGNYSLTVRDQDNCTINLSLNVSDINDVMVEAEMEVSGCETSNGTIEITALNGQEPYTYSLDGGSSQTNNTFSGLEKGDYTVLVSDNDGCEASITVSVLSGISYSNQILPIVNASCAINNCHDGSNTDIPDWTNLATVQANAANIKTRTADGSMPPAGRPDLSTTDIQAIACWVDDGALDN